MFEKVKFSLKIFDRFRNLSLVFRIDALFLFFIFIFMFELVKILIYIMYTGKRAVRDATILSVFIFWLLFLGAFEHPASK